MHTNCLCIATNEILNRPDWHVKRFVATQQNVLDFSKLMKYISNNVTGAGFTEFLRARLCFCNKVVPVLG
jgi:hypothetical protein